MIAEARRREVKSIITMMLQQATEAEGPSGPIPSKLREVLVKLESGEMTPSVSLRTAEALVSCGENGIMKEKLKELSVAKKH
ncbi:MAG: hypothetical protein CEO12_309 [Parcubacteria group bacterium Gr01-1014_46]|nr:MAG: hypothetical protein CEO12_309 [Parcubacteria group bacterium Gr01-1014_46]